MTVYVFVVSVFGEVDFTELVCSSFISFVKIMSGCTHPLCQPSPLSAF